jgi:hypothetical protein
MLSFHNGGWQGMRMQRMAGWAVEAGWAVKRQNNISFFISSVTSKYIDAKAAGECRWGHWNKIDQGWFRHMRCVCCLGEQ